jgi:hypothetical protein
VETPNPQLSSKEVEILILQMRIAELEIENRRLWDAMRATGVLLQKLLED